MRALVTGSAGFVGNHVVRCLLAHHDDVAVLVRPESALWRIADVLPQLVVIEAEPRLLESAAPRVADFMPETVFHLAWSGVHGAERHDPSHLEANLRHTVAVVELAAAAGASTIIGLGSQAEYGPHDGVIDEGTPLRPTSPYGVGKLLAGIVMDCIAKAHGMRAVWLRLLSAYGPADEPSYLIPYIIRELLTGGTPELSSGDQPHDTLYGCDVAEALRAAAIDERCRGTYVLASGQSLSVRTIAETARDLLSPAAPLHFGRSAGHPGWRGSHGKLTEDTGWSPSTPLGVGLEETARWYREHGARA